MHGIRVQAAGVLNPYRFERRVHINVSRWRRLALAAQVRQGAGADDQAIVIGMKNDVTATAELSAQCITAAQPRDKAATNNRVPIHPFDVVEQAQAVYMRQGIDHQAGVLLRQLVFQREVVMAVIRKHARQTAITMLCMHLITQVFKPAFIALSAFGLKQHRQRQDHFQTGAINVGVTLRRVHDKQPIFGSFLQRATANRPDKLLVRRTVENLASTSGKAAGRHFAQVLVELPFEPGFELLTKPDETFVYPLLCFQCVAVPEVERGNQPQANDWVAFSRVDRQTRSLIPEPTQRAYVIRDNF